MKKIFHFLVLFLVSIASMGQVGVGNVGIGTTAPDLSAALDIVSSDKGILIPRVALTGLTDITTITQGNKISLLVYNTAYTNDVVPGFYYWNSQKWAKIAEGNGSLYSGTGSPSFTNPKNPTEGDFYIELPSGKLHHFDGEGWRTLSGVSNDPENLLTMGSDGKYFLNPAFIKALMSAENGLSKNTDNKIQLGGNLVKATTLQTTSSNTLAITGLDSGNLNQDEFVTIDPVSGVLSKTSVSSLLTINESIQTGVDGQTIFLTPSHISDIKKVHVYRNGVRISSTYINSNTIKLEDGVSCFAGDEIRIVQFN